MNQIGISRVLIGLISIFIISNIACKRKAELKPLDDVNFTVGSLGKDVLFYNTDFYEDDVDMVSPSNEHCIKVSSNTAVDIQDITEPKDDVLKREWRIYKFDSSLPEEPTSIEEAFSHTFAEPGIYEIKLQANNEVRYRLIQVLGDGYEPPATEELALDDMDDPYEEDDPYTNDDPQYVADNSSSPSVSPSTPSSTKKATSSSPKSTTPKKSTSSKTSTKPADSDGDRVPDSRDECPNEFGEIATNGCPDTDADGVADKKDKCPYEYGKASNNGCPVKTSSTPPKKTTTSSSTKKTTPPPKKTSSSTSTSTKPASTSTTKKTEPVKTTTKPATSTTPPPKKNVPPPPPPKFDADDDFFCTSAGTYVGVRLRDRCATSNSDISYVSNGKITIKPKRKMMLQKARLWASDNGKIKVEISYNNGGKIQKETAVKRVNPGRSDILLEDLDLVLQPGGTYTISIVSMDGVKIENIAKCGASNTGNADLGIDYKGNYVLFDLKYCY